MSDQSPDYAVGYGRPPAATRFQKGRSGNPGGRPRGKKTLSALLAEALSEPSGFPNADGSWKTQAEMIFAGLVGAAVGPDLKAKRLLFDIMVKLQRANMGWPQDRLPEVELCAVEGDARAEVEADLDGRVEEMTRKARAHGALPTDRLKENV